MTQEFTLANARLVLRDETVTGSLRVEGGKIAAMDQGCSVPNGAVDCEGDYLAPGLVELHTDNLERHITPRPRVDWPHKAAIVAHDAELANVGITTVFDAIRVGSILTQKKAGYRKYARKMASEILTMREAGALKISHHLHLRAEICSETLIEELAEFGPDDRVGIVSLMDHTPGQRQFTDISKFEAYVRGKYAMDQMTFATYVEHLHDLQSRLGVIHEAEAVKAAARYEAVLASHDDTTAEHVAVSRAHGVGLAEFPTTMVAAQACRTAGIAVMMGAPNVIRGGSHSGNVSAEALSDCGLLDILSSDYVPAALLMAAVRLGLKSGDIAHGLATVTDAPARAARLPDRGRLKVGLRADLIRLRLAGDVPVLQGVWSEGNRAA